MVKAHFVSERSQERQVEMSMMPQRSNRNLVAQPTYTQNIDGEPLLERTKPVALRQRERRRKSLAKWTQVISLIFFILETGLAFRVLLRLIAANPGNEFARFVYQLTFPFSAPFAGLTAMPAANGSVFEISTIIGMAVYGVLYLVIIRGMWVIFNPSKTLDADRYEPDL
jgi:hypothetical protein